MGRYEKSIGKCISEGVVRMSICERCLHNEVCGLEGIYDEALKFCDDFIGWIPVSERLPRPNRLVLCYITTNATETYFLALWNDTLNAWEEGIGGYRLLENDLGYEVIKWMPLPESYREGGE